MLEPVLASWWGFAEADRTLLGLVVALLFAFALAYVLLRVGRSRADRRAAAGGRPTRRP